MCNKRDLKSVRAVCVSCLLSPVSPLLYGTQGRFQVLSNVKLCVSVPDPPFLSRLPLLGRATIIKWNIFSEQLEWSSSWLQHLWALWPSLGAPRCSTEPPRFHAGEATGISRHRAAAPALLCASVGDGAWECLSRPIKGMICETPAIYLINHQHRAIKPIISKKKFLFVCHVLNRLRRIKEVTQWCIYNIVPKAGKLPHILSLSFQPLNVVSRNTALQIISDIY